MTNPIKPKSKKLPVAIWIIAGIFLMGIMVMANVSAESVKVSCIDNRQIDKMACAVIDSDKQLVTSCEYDVNNPRWYQKILSFFTKKVYETYDVRFLECQNSNDLTDCTFIRNQLNDVDAQSFLYSCDWNPKEYGK